MIFPTNKNFALFGALSGKVHCSSDYSFVSGI